MNGLRRIVWLASFPKSGNTWLRTFLANYFQPPGQALDINSLRRFTTSDVRQDFFDWAHGKPFRAETIEEWLRVRPKALRLIASSKSGHHFVKTHCQIARIGEIDLIPSEVTAAAVYVLRNPFDIAPSYARHLSLDIDAAISRMTDPTATHANPNRVMEMIGRWDDHVRSWAEAPGLPLHVVRYEDLLADTERAFRALLGFLRIDASDGQLRRTIRATSFEALQRQEREIGFLERPPGMEQFFARGTAGGWHEDLTPAQVARLRAEFLPVIEKWYPEMLRETEEFATGEARQA